MTEVAIIIDREFSPQILIHCCLWVDWVSFKFEQTSYWLVPSCTRMLSCSQAALCLI